MRTCSTGAGPGPAARRSARPGRCGPCTSRTTKCRRWCARRGSKSCIPSTGTKPRVYYRNLDRYFKAFVGGSVAGEIGGVTECIEGARVSLYRGGQKVAEARSDPYGDFKFQGLDEGSGRYRIEILHERFEPKRLEFDVGESSYLGTIELICHGNEDYRHARGTIRDE